MLICVVVGIALEVFAFLILLPHGLVTAIVGATAAGTIGIVGTGAVLAVTGASLGEKSGMSNSMERPPEKKKQKGPEPT
jgi:hypothetical protein